MTAAAKQQARINQELQAAKTDNRQGTCTGIDWAKGLATVVIPGSLLTLPMIGQPPIIGAECVVVFFGNTAFVESIPRSPYATVTGTPSGGLVEITGDDNIRHDVTYTDDTGLTAGAKVLIDWSGGGQILGLPQADPNTGQPLNLPAVIPGGGPQARTFNPYTSATWADGYYSSGWKTGQLQDSDHNRGAWFYQGIADTIPDNATDGHLSIYIPEGDGYGGDPSIGAHGLSGPAGALGITGRKAFPAKGGNRWFDISEFFDAFKTGALLGIGTGGGGNWRFPAAGQYNSGAISATWRT